MAWLVDPNIFAANPKGSHSHPGVADWWASAEQRDLFLSVMTLGEIRRRIERVRHRDPAKAVGLERWLHDMIDASGARIVGIDLTVPDARGGHVGSAIRPGWQRDCNTDRPHVSLAYRPPVTETISPPRWPFESAALRLRPAWREMLRFTCL